MATRNLWDILKKSWIILATLVVAVIVIVLAYANKKPVTPKANPADLIDAAIAATMEAIPDASPTPRPTFAPTMTPFSIEGVFCEYDFCIGHPKDIYMVDEGATRQPPAASTFGYGVLFAYSNNLFIEMAWTTSGPSFDPQTTMRYILEEKETLQGAIEAQLMGKLNVYYQPITTVTEALPFGGIAAWQCGGRDFTWKVYTPQDGMAAGLFKEAIEKFQCSK